MTSPAAPDYFELSDYLSPLRRRWLTIALLTCVGIVAAAAYLYLAPRAYTATVLVQVNALPNNANAVGGRTGGPVNMDNEAQALRSTAVAAIVKSRLHSPMSVADIAQEIKVTVPPNTTFLQITVPAPTARDAQRWANAVGQAYLDNRRLSTQTLIGSGVKALQARARDLSTSIERLKIIIASTRHLSKNPTSDPVLVSDGLRLAGELGSLTSVQAHIDAALPLYASLTAHNSVIVGSIVSPATLPTTPSSPRKLLVLPSGLIVGLLIGLALAFVADRRDKRVHSARDVERAASVPTLLSLTAPGQGPVTGLESPRTAAGQAFGELARSVAATLGEDGHVIVVTATSAGSSGSVLTANLAAALARSGDETVVICGDLRGTMAPELLGAGRGRGLSELLAGTASIADVAGRAQVSPQLRVIPPGLDPYGAAPVLRHATVQQIVTDLLAGARYVIIEVQSVGENAETFSLAEYAQAAIVTAEIGRSQPADVTECVQRLDRLGAPVLGTAILPAMTAGRKRKKARASQDLPGPAGRPLNVVQPDRQEQPQAAASGAFTWPPGGARASGQVAAAYPSGSESRHVSETWPMPKVPVAARDGYPDVADPGTED